MDLPTFLLAVLSLMFGLALAVGIYAMSISVTDPRLARCTSWIAWVSLLCLFIMFGVVGDMGRVSRYALSGTLAALGTICLCASLDYIRVRTPAASAPSLPQTVSPSATNSPPVQVLRDLQVSGPYPGEDVIRLIGRPNVTIDRIRVFIDYSGDTGAPSRTRGEIGELKDVVKDKFINYAIARYRQDRQAQSDFVWNGPDAIAIYPGISHARIVLIDQHGIEQHYAFRIYLGNPRIQLNIGSNVNNPGFLIKNEGADWSW